MPASHGNMSTQLLNSKLIAQRLLRELPEATHTQALQDAASSRATGSDTLQDIIDTSATVLLCPEHTIGVARAVGPLLLHVVATALCAVRRVGSIPTNVQGTISRHGPARGDGVGMGASIAASPMESAETVLVSMSRLLPSAPHVLPLALQHWRSTPTPFDCLVQHSQANKTVEPARAPSSTVTESSLFQPGCSSTQGTLTTVGEEMAIPLLTRVRTVTEAAHKLLSCPALRSSLRDLWNWTPFFHLCRHEDPIVRWRAVCICATLLNLDEGGRRKLLSSAGVSSLKSTTHVHKPRAWSSTSISSKTSSNAAAEVESIQNDNTEVILKAEVDFFQEARLAPFLLRGQRILGSDRQEERGDEQRSATEPVSDAASTEEANAMHLPIRLHPSVVDIGGVLHVKTALPLNSSSSQQILTTSDTPGDHPRFVPTASASRNLHSLSLAMAIDRPVLLHGPAGSGKSLLVREVARLVTGGGDGSVSSPALLELHLDDQTDSKSLLGSHACTDIPGEFAWQPGALTRAAAAGTWVLIEDLDRAPLEVLAALGPLLEGRPLVLPGRKKPLSAAHGFRVFGTVTTTGPGRVVLGGAADFGALWIHVPVEPLTSQETLEVAKVRYPGLPSPALRRLLETLNAAKINPGDRRSTVSFASSSSGGREPGVRDFLKLCSRVHSSGVFEDVGEENQVSEGWFCSEAQALPVVRESLDVFAGHLTTKEAVTHAAEIVAGLWNVLPSKAIDLAIINRPELVQGKDYMKIGRVTLPKIHQVSARHSSSFAPTSHALRLMETLAAAVQAREPILLVGETGCGKTALVQRLAEGTGRNLLVQNLSLQTDGADLLGGFRPVELRQLARGVLEEFLGLFPQLFSARQNGGFCQAITSAFERRQWKRLSAGLRNAAKIASEKLDRSSSEDRSEDRSSKSTGEKNKVRKTSSANGWTSPSGQRRDWEGFSRNADKFERQRAAVEGSFAFSFVEGVLVKALREGKWVLLDEINLASAETLQRLSGLLEGAEGSLCLTERGDVDPVVRHPDFRLFAAMNPPTDASKKDLPPALRRRFSEVYVPELVDRNDLKRVVDGYLSGVPSLEQDHLAFTAVDLYLWARGLAAESLSDGAGQRPRYTLRTLVGAVSGARRLIDRGFGPRRAMVEGFRGAFETHLDRDGRARIVKGILKAFGNGLTAKDLDKPPRRPGGRSGGREHWVLVGPFWIEGGPLDPVDAAHLDVTTKQRRFVLTTSVESTLRCLARAVASSDSSVLLQGPTSAGKTSIVEYLAARLGHRCVRINNHEHTDIQEYTGSYTTDSNGKMAFREGILVEALRNGYWIILDELNLAPSDVLEALNRLLDHNRELYLPEIQETVKPHPNFRLFATQNPPGAYGGRKPLSRAFRNRFMEIHVEDIPGSEWEIILADRCGLPPSHCKLLVKVLHELQVQRQSSRLFLGKNGAISPRDLLRWAGRKPQGKQQLAEEGYMLLAERLRSEDEKAAMRAVLEEQIGVTLDPSSLYGAAAVDVDGMLVDGVNKENLGQADQLTVVEAMLRRGDGLDAGLTGVATTRHMRRLFRLSGRCLSHKEPLLLVGETGCGKTTVCQLYSILLQRRMHVVNCHQNSEAADLLGGLRPLRGRDKLVEELRERAHIFLHRCAEATKRISGGHEAMIEIADVQKIDVAGIMGLLQAAFKVKAGFSRQTNTEEPLVDKEKTSSPSPIQLQRSKAKRARSSLNRTSRDAQEPSVLGHIEPLNGKQQRSKGEKKKRRRSDASCTEERSATAEESAIGEEVSTDDFVSLEAEMVSLEALTMRTKGMFEWVDGPLVTAMRNGELILLDELSLADDAVLERLNSVLEPGRSITLPEKGGEGSGASETLVAAPGFRVMATMNPGGDFGKRELSPALRSRFTEVWVPALSDREDMEGVVQKAFMMVNGSVIDEGYVAQMASRMLDFAWWFNNMALSSLGGGKQLTLSIRDVLSWAGFVTASLSKRPLTRVDRSNFVLKPWEAYVHGAALVLLDGMGLGAALSPAALASLKKACVAVLTEQIPDCPERASAISQLSRDGEPSTAKNGVKFEIRSSKSPPIQAISESGIPGEGQVLSSRSNQEFGVVPFFVPCGPRKALGPDSDDLGFSVGAPTTAHNVYRVLRALQVRKAVLLEGSPGVGKTSLVAALSAATGHELVRINLSEQTDISDLFGSDLPVPDSDDEDSNGSRSGGAKFAWCDGVFLRALKAGKWVLLDELNLATQSVLEGLNACLDHRAEVYIPELGRSFRCPKTFKIFAAQNPLGQGGGRKGLPRSFLSRFTKVYIDPLTADDLIFIASKRFPILAADGSSQGSLLSRMIAFNSLVQRDTAEGGRYGRHGSPWEFNLRDVFRWCELMLREQRSIHDTNIWEPSQVVDTLYMQRMRTQDDRNALLMRFKGVFPEAFVDVSGGRHGAAYSAGIGTHPVLTVTPEWIQVGYTVLQRGCWVDGSSGPRTMTAEGSRAGLPLALGLRRPLQALARCVAMRWPTLVMGHRGTGKSSIIRSLAMAVGARLTEVAMTPSVDVTELLGCYEQVDSRAEHDALLDELHVLTFNACHSLLQCHDDTRSLTLAGTLWDAWSTVRGCFKNPFSPFSSTGKQGLQEAIGFDVQGMAPLDTLLSRLTTAVSTLSEQQIADDGLTKSCTLTLKRRLDEAILLAESIRKTVRKTGNQTDQTDRSTSCFRWSDGVLVEALQRGDWVVLDGANLCSASVLDRLNPLLEPGGVLLLTECGTSPDKDDDFGSATTHRVIRPHPNFRLFLTADPSCGEVSRAMRNRCLEISLLDVPPPLVVTPSLPLSALTEHALDAFYLAHATGLGDLCSMASAVALHSALGARHSLRASNAEGLPPRALLIMAELAAALESRGIYHSYASIDARRPYLEMAYPWVSKAMTSSVEMDVVEACRQACVEWKKQCSAVDLMSPSRWDDWVEQGVMSRVLQDSKVWQLAIIAVSEGDNEKGIYSLFVDSVRNGGQAGSNAVKGDFALQPRDEDFLLSPNKLSSLEETDVDTSSRILLHAAALFARRASAIDRELRAEFATKLMTPRHEGQSVEAIRFMMAAVFDSRAWRDASCLITEVVSGMSGKVDKKEIGSLWDNIKTSTSQNLFGNPNHYNALRRALLPFGAWASAMFLIDLLHAAVICRLPIIIKERAELSKARSRCADGNYGENGLGWIGLSYMMCEGGLDMVKASTRSRREHDQDTRLARSLVIPYILPLLRAVDAVVDSVMHREAAQVVLREEAGLADKVVDGVRALMQARDTVSAVLMPPTLDGSNHGTFSWNHFLIAWEWLGEKRLSLETSLMESPSFFQHLESVSSKLARLGSVCAFIDKSVLEHAGGASPAKETLWSHGDKAAAATTAKGALALGRLHKLAERFRVSDQGFRSVISLSSLMRDAHPLLCVPVTFRKELLHALCTVYWAASTESDTSILTIQPSMIDVIPGQDEAVDGVGAVGAPLVEVLPVVLEDELRLAQARFENKFKGITLASGAPQPSHEGSDNGDMFDEQDTRTANTVANASLFVCDASDVVGASSGGNVLQQWTSFQLSVLREHWIAVEECQILAILATLLTQKASVSRADVSPVMSRVACLRSVMLASSSLSPALARPYQTLLWAWGSPTSWPMVYMRLLSRLLPVALESWGRRLWEDLAGVVSLELSPPQIFNEGQGQGSVLIDPASTLLHFHEGPVQLLTLGRSSILLRLTSCTAFLDGMMRHGHGCNADLTLMNASARLGQYRAAIRSVRDLSYGDTAAVTSLVTLSWARLIGTLQPFDTFREGVEGKTEGQNSFGAVLGQACPGGDTWDRVGSPLKDLLRVCHDKRLTKHGDSLVIPAVKALCHARDALEKEAGKLAWSLKTDIAAGIGVVYLGCLRLALLLPSSPVDPGLRPALEKELLEERLAGVKGDLTVQRWSLRLEGRGDASPEMMPLLHEARCIRDDCRRLSREAIERPPERPSFHALFRDVHAFSNGIGNPSRVTALAEGLARIVDEGQADGDAIGFASLLQEETTWQETSGAFTKRFRSIYGDCYTDVVIGICDAVETTRVGLRLLASSAAEISRVRPRRESSDGDHNLARLQGVLLSFPMAYGSMMAFDGPILEGFEEGGNGYSHSTHMAVLQAMVSRAELLLSTECVTKPALDAAVVAMDSAVRAWSLREEEEAERRRKEEEILKYKVQEHVVESEEAKSLAKQRSLFPDYHGSFKDIESDNVDVDGVTDNQGSSGSNGPDLKTNALVGRISEDQLAFLVASHARIFLSRCARHSLWLQALFSKLVGHHQPKGPWWSPCNLERLAAFRECYRACVLLVECTSKLSLCRRGKPQHLEEEFAASHTLALANAAKLCMSGKGLLEEAAVVQSLGGTKSIAVPGVMAGSNWVGEGAAGRILHSVNPCTNFHLDPDVTESRLADRPLAGVLRRVAELLEEFPGHGVLTQLARVLDRVRRMPLHSPLAAFLAGVELALRKAQDWEQIAHRGVSLTEELRPLSALVVRWRAVELKSWPKLLDDRERSYALKANRWWLHLYRLITGEWTGASSGAGMLGESSRAENLPGVAGVSLVGKVYSSPDWPNARKLFPDWLWSGLVPEARAYSSDNHKHTAALDHARGLFQPLDDFLRTATIGEFFARLQMVRAFAAQITDTARMIGLEEDQRSRSSHALAAVLQGLWLYYSQFSEEVTSTRNGVRQGIEKKLKEEAKLAKWDEQTYYSLAESSDKSHRKLSKLVAQYDEVLEVSVSEVLNRAFTSGVGERMDSGGSQPASACTDIPSLVTMFPVVKKVDSVGDMFDQDEPTEIEDGHDNQPVKSRLKSKSVTSMQELNATLPLEPSYIRIDISGVNVLLLPRWLRDAIAPDLTGAPHLITRLSALAQRMRSLLRKQLYGRGQYGKDLYVGAWMENGRPAGFLGAGVAEELCSAVFARIQSLRAKGVGKQVKKRAVLDLLGGMHKQGLHHTKSSTPSQVSDMLHIMSLNQPLPVERLAGMDRPWLFPTSDDDHACEMLDKAERYFLRSLNELSRIRLEAGAAISKDVTRREAEVMRGLSENLGLLVLQQRAAQAVLESDLLSLTQEVDAIRSLKENLDAHETRRPKGNDCRAVPPQTPLRNAVETQTKGLLQSLEALREMRMLVQAVAEVDPPCTVSSRTDELGWGEGPMDASKCSDLTDSLSVSERLVVEMLGSLPRYCEAVSAQGDSHVIMPLLSHGILTAVLSNQEKMRSLAEDWEKNRNAFDHVVPPAAMGRVVNHINAVVTLVDSDLQDNPLIKKHIEAMTGNTGDSGGSPEPNINAAHVSRIGGLASEAVKSMLLTVQILHNPGGNTVKDSCELDEPMGDGVDKSEAFSTESSLLDAHISAFEQARCLKLWRCTARLKSLRSALQEMSECEELVEDGWERFAEACEVLVCLVADVAEMAQQVLAAGRAVFIGLVALNKGTAKLHYVMVRVFRTLLSKGLCADETEDAEGGEGNIEGMKFDDDVEGTGMGEGEGKKDVTDQIEDEEQLLGLKGDQENKEQPEQGKELGDDQDKGMEMENDFDGEMFDVPKGEDKDDDEDIEEDTEELDREMGDLGDNADIDVVDEKLWDQDDDDGDDDGQDDRGEEKFEEGSRLDGEKAEEDEIRTKEDGQEQEQKEAKDDGKEEEEKKGDEGQGQREEQGQGQDENDKEGEEGEGPVNDDLEDNYEDKPQGVEVRGKEEAMEVDEVGREGDEGEGEDKEGFDEEQDMPDDLNLDDDQEVPGKEEAMEVDEVGREGDEGEGEDKEGFDEEQDISDDLNLDDDQEGASNPGIPEMEQAEQGDDNPRDEAMDEEIGEDESHRRAEEEPPAFGVQGVGGESTVLDMTKEDDDGGHEGEEREGDKDPQNEGKDSRGGAPDAMEDGEGGGQGDDGQSGEWRADFPGEGRGEGLGGDKRRVPEAPNPFRDPGDVMQHWHRRLDMLKDRERNDCDMSNGNNGEDDDADDESGEGKFEYVTANERGFSQVMGGVSEEQAAEAAAQQSEEAGHGHCEDDDKEATVEGDLDDTVGDTGIETDVMEGGESQEAMDVDQMDNDDLRVEKADTVEKRRKSGKKRATDGHQAETEEGANLPSEEDEDMSSEKPPVDTNSLEELSCVKGGVSHVVTNPLGETSFGRQRVRLREQLHELAEELQRKNRELEGNEVGVEISRQTWGKLRSVTGGLAQRLCEQLRLVLEPMVATKLQGDYRSGKRLNMRRVIPYIASGFRKDKIWLRRTKPAKRDYQILMAIDDSESMADCGAGALALAAMTTVASGLTQLEAGQLAVARFGEDLELLHGFGKAFTEEAGAKIVNAFTFSQQRTNTAHTLESVVSLLEDARNTFSLSSGSVSSKGTPRQLVLLLSDGRFDRENKDRLRNLVREMNERGQLLVLVVLDKDGDTSILKTREASYVNGKLVITSYLDKYPFPLYILLNDVEALPEVLADALRQWFELLQLQSSG